MGYHQTPIMQRGLVSPLMTPKTSALFAFGEMPTKSSDLEKVGNVFEMMKKQAESQPSNPIVTVSNASKPPMLKNQLIK